MCQAVKEVPVVPVHKGYGTQYGAGGSGYGFMVHIDLALRQYRSPVQITVVGSQLLGIEIAHRDLTLMK